MDKEKVREIIYIIIATILAIIAVKFVIWLLPIILIAIVAYLIYNSMRKKKNGNVTVIHDYDDNKNKKK